MAVKPGLWRWAERCCDPTVKMVRWRVHHSGKLAAVIAAGMPATLHAFDNIHILGKDGAPHLGIGGPHLGKFIAAGRLVGIIDLDLFMGSAGAIGPQEYRIILIGVIDDIPFGLGEIDDGKIILSGFSHEKDSTYT